MGDDACAIACVVAAKKLIGPTFFSWEPESIRLELTDLDVEILDENFNALMAVITLRETTNFFWDANVFENVCVALNGETPQFDIVHELAPGQIAWGVEQANMIVDNFSDHEIPEGLEMVERFDYEPVEYAVSSCLRAGLITVPEELLFIQDRIEVRTQAPQKLVGDVKKSWNELEKCKCQEHPFSEDAIGVQLALMSAVHLYVKEQKELLQSQLRMLEQP